MMQQAAKTGTNTVAAGGTAETVVLGFQPSYVRAINVNNLTSYEYFAGMTADYSITDANGGTVAAATSGGITLTADGFTLGTAICDTTSDVVRWLAIR